MIERSHRSDDEEFLIPFGAEMKTKEPFMIQAQEYSDYWNTKRSHSGHGMDGRTPREQLIKRGLSTIQAQRILDFKVLYLDESFYTLQEHFQYFLFQKELLETKKEKSQEKSQEKGQERLFEDRKTSLDLITRYAHLKHYAPPPSAKKFHRTAELSITKRCVSTSFISSIYIFYAYSSFAFFP